MIKHRTQLPDLMRELKLPMMAAEIGVAEGYFSAELLHGGMEKLYMVDIWRTENVKGDGSMPQEWHDKNYNSAMLRVGNFLDKVVILKGFSEAKSIHVPDNSLGLVYLDAGHSYEDVFKDLTVWIPKLIEGGIMAGHDYLNKAYGVYEAVEYFTNGKFTVNIITENKDEDSGFWFLNK
jgi:hypothetical protein